MYVKLSHKIACAAETAGDLFCSELEILPSWFEEALGCKRESKQVTKKPKLNLGGDLLKKFKFETRQKTLPEKLNEKINQAFAYLQRLVLPEKYVLPCLLGDCDMGEKIKKEKEVYTNLLRKQVPLTPPEQSDSRTAPKASKGSPAPSIPQAKISKTPDIPDSENTKKT